jgi:hypothetical protein
MDALQSRLGSSTHGEAARGDSEKLSVLSRRFYIWPTVRQSTVDVRCQAQSACSNRVRRKRAPIAVVVAVRLGSDWRRCVLGLKPSAAVGGLAARALPVVS